jgi:hypothetical protein
MNFGNKFVTNHIAVRVTVNVNDYAGRDTKMFFLFKHRLLRMNLVLRRVPFIMSPSTAAVVIESLHPSGHPVTAASLRVHTILRGNLQKCMDLHGVCLT